MEATGTYWEAAAARLIADFCANQRPPLWTPPPPAQRELRALVARREALVVMRTQEQNRLPVAHPRVRPGIEALIAHLEGVIAEVEAAIRQRIDGDPDLKTPQRLLDSVPGLGDKTIPVLLAFYGGPDRFDHVHQIAAFAGLNPRQHQSGSRVRGKPRLSTDGHAGLHKALYLPTMVTLHKTAWGARLSGSPRRRQGPRVIIGAMMRKLVHVTFGVLKSAQLFNPALHGA